MCPTASRVIFCLPALFLAVAVAVPVNAQPRVPFASPAAEKLVLAADSDRDAAKRKYRANKQRRAAKKAALKKLDRLDRNYDSARDKVRIAKNKAKKRALASAANPSALLDSETRAELQEAGGSFLVGQAEMAGLESAMEAASKPEEKQALSRAHTAAKAKVDALKDKLRPLQLGMIELQRDDDAVGLNADDKRRMIENRKLLKRLAGNVGVESFDAIMGLERVAAETGISPFSPFLEGLVAVPEGLTVERAADQGREMTCGYECARMVLKSRLGNKATKDKLEKALKVRSSTDGVAGGLPPEIVAEILTKAGVKSKAQKLPARAGGAGVLAKRLKAEPGAGPFVVGVKADPRAQKLARVANDLGYTALYLPAGAAPSTNAAAVAASARNAYEHYVVIDDVIDIDVSDQDGNSRKEEHFIVRDPDGGRTFLHSVKDFGNIFDGTLVAPDAS